MFKDQPCCADILYVITLINISLNMSSYVQVESSVCSADTRPLEYDNKKPSNIKRVDNAVYCLDLAVYLDMSLQETGDALMGQPVSCTSLLTAAEMLSCKSTAPELYSRLISVYSSFGLYVVQHQAMLHQAMLLHMTKLQVQHQDAAEPYLTS